MNWFELDCPMAEDPVQVQFTGEVLPRGKAMYRGFACEMEARCEAAGIRCGLFDAGGLEPFNPAEALRHLNG
ncbi:MAG: hypothetical protein DPW14_16790 [Planctomycetes bacterium]|nr:hypothetical protein [Planctomycetota bacterium]